MNEIIKKNGVQYGLVIGLISILTTLFIYLTNIELFTSGWITFIKYGLYLIIIFLLLRKTQKDFETGITFKETFTTYFIATTIGILMGSLFELILFNVIDSSLKESVKEIIIKETGTMLQKFGTPRSVIKESIKQLEMQDQFSIGNFFKGTIFTILISAIFGLILSAFFKTKSSNQL
ncbi:MULTISPECIES: DUF4199 domain-containing protein [Flavobacterium]|uniref:DUF4199 domain-containing protein n=2 Tax=Flavobacterium TaxID=237 RepID=A0AA94F0N7_9FLAO|nr:MULTISPECIES: DUF4199 domain-containing protein [Flavobacterium]OXA82738.1 DUF4199 domain-containing protein [Flavobacterium columnare NBRC 100251 = ATCC 23463]AMA49555.1 hypothetical protein AWN65_08830 [Flavobacterium covae]AND63254.1 hypothetical protein AX766_01840 [Flavobacterium covae]MCH4828840.1 DUF4199 domain-containing protein [Flavobacterium columnare]MCH4832094.1 DUF4199 domain-containing protein [Flavobacterium columnare]